MHFEAFNTYWIHLGFDPQVRLWDLFSETLTKNCFTQQRYWLKRCQLKSTLFSSSVVIRTFRWKQFGSCWLVSISSSEFDTGSTFCQKISLEEFNRQKRDQTSDELVKMMLSYLADPIVAVKVKRSRLDQFRIHHPELFARHLSALQIWREQRLSEPAMTIKP